MSIRSFVIPKPWDILDLDKIVPSSVAKARTSRTSPRPILSSATSVSPDVHDSLCLVLLSSLFVVALQDDTLCTISSKCFLTFSTSSSGPINLKTQGTLRPPCGKSLLRLLFSVTVQYTAPRLRKKSEVTRDRLRHMTNCFSVFLNCNSEGILAVVAIESTTELLFNVRRPHCAIHMKSANAAFHFVHLPPPSRSQHRSPFYSLVIL